MKPLRILQVSAFPVFDLGGVGKVVQWLLADLAVENKVGLAAPDIDSTARRSELKTPLEDAIAVPEQKWNGAVSRQFVEQVRAGHYDVVHFHGGLFSFDAHLMWRGPQRQLTRAGIAWVQTNHTVPSFTSGLFPPNYPAVLKPLKTALAWCSKSALLSQCQFEVFVSDENRRNLEPVFPWAKSKFRTVYPSGLEGTPPAPVFVEEPVTISNLGHVAVRKGQQDLFKAFLLAREKLPQLKLILAGPHHEPELAGWLQAEIKARKLEEAVQLPGGLTDKTAFWRETDIYVQPSHYEGAPMSLMEALWLGKPAIGTRVSGIPEMIRHEHNGLLVEAGRPEEMAAAIERLLREPETRRRLGENAAPHIQAVGMTRAAMCRNYLNLYHEMLG